MRIANNISAMNTHRVLVGSDNQMGKSLERLSSGLRINRAADDAAGLAISEKMRAQIRGLKQASRNAQDGISMIQTAEGGLNETHAILQRMRELAVQAANGTLTDSDKAEVQKEVAQLIEEIDRIGNTTEFNTKKLLNGQAGVTSSQANGVASDGVVINGTTTTAASGATGGAVSQADLDAVITSLSAGPNTKTGVYQVEITKQATAASITGNQDISTGTGADGILNINGVAIELGAGDTGATIVSKINNYSAQTGVKAELDGSNNLILTTTGLGSDATLTVSSTDGNFLSALGLAGTGEYITTTVGSDAVGTINGEAAIGKGNTLTLTKAGDDADGLTVNFDGSKLDLGATGTLTFDAVINSDGQVTLQIGANDKQTLSFTINDMRSKALGIDELDVTTPNGAAEAIKKLDNALTLVSAERSKLGAIQNRLEHTISNLGVAAENIAASESRIRDIDMAEEMTNFTKNQILVQASTAMLAQANQKSQAVLKLLG